MPSCFVISTTSNAYQKRTSQSVAVFAYFMSWNALFHVMECSLSCHGMLSFMSWNALFLARLDSFRATTREPRITFEPVFIALSAMYWGMSKFSAISYGHETKIAGLLTRACLATQCVTEFKQLKNACGRFVCTGHLVTPHVVP